MEGRYEFYGSPAALYSRHTADELGITQGGLNNYFCMQPQSTYKTSNPQLSSSASFLRLNVLSSLN